MPIPLSDVTAYLHTHIPLTRTMGITVAGRDGPNIILAAPLAPNLNHTDTAFGGSISSLAILAGYAGLYLLLRERDISMRILIQKSSVEFHRPVDADMTAVCAAPTGTALEEFLDTLRRKRRARVTLESHVYSGKSLAATHSGLYVALLY